MSAYMSFSAYIFLRRLWSNNLILKSFSEIK